MGTAVIIHAPIGGGKTSTASAVAEMAKSKGLRVLGILSKRVMTGNPHASYMINDLASGEVWPLVVPQEDSPGEGWETHGNPVYSFSVIGFKRANAVLYRAVEQMGPSSIIFVDEFGRLESGGEGIYPGALASASAIVRGGTVVFLCRTERVEEVKRLLDGKAGKILVFVAGDPQSVYDVIQTWL